MKKVLLIFSAIFAVYSFQSLQGYVQEIKDVLPQDVTVTVNSNVNVATCSSKRGDVTCRAFTETGAQVTKG